MSIISQVNAKRKSVFYGWWVVVAATFINAFGVGCFFYGWSTFFKPLQREFGWSRTVVSGVSSMSRLQGGFEGPLIGWLIDKIGSRKVLLIAVSATGAGFVALSRVNSLWSFYVLFFFLALGYNMGYTYATTAAVAKWFIKKRSQALSYLTTGNGIGGAVFVPLLSWMILHYGWRWTSIIIGVSMWALVIPVAAFGIKDSAEQMGLLPDGIPATPAKEADQKVESAEGVALASESDLDEVNFTVVEALKTQTFWVYTGAMFLRAAILSSLVIHQIPHLTDIGIPEVQAASVLGLMVLLSIPGRLAFGWLGDRVNKKLLLLVASLLQAGGILIFIHASTMPLLYLFDVVYGLGYGGAIPLTPALLADSFGRKSFATINGVTPPFTMVSGIAGPIVAGYLYDTTHSYSLAFYAFAIMISVSGVLFLFIRKPKPPARLALARR